MSETRRRVWLIVRWSLAIAILAFVGYRFWADLSRLDVVDINLRPAWLVASGLLYMAGLLPSFWFWRRLMWKYGQRPSFFRSLRAYYIGHLGKYVPGKAVALVMRASCVSGPEAKFGIAIVTSAYEVLTMMAAGGMTAAVLFLIQPPTVFPGDWNPVVIGVIILAIVGIPLTPGLFNRALKGLAARFGVSQFSELYRLRVATLLEGLLLMSVGWAIMGLSLWTCVQAVLSETQMLDISLWSRYTAIVSLAYVAAFLVVVVPGGMGVREFFLVELITPELPSGGTVEIAGTAVVIGIVLRLVWTAADVISAAVVYLPGKRPSEPEHKT
ncbi:MAG: lysylphosphatidylglycerol synthase domain-containing protein [Gemmataceae bacterium]